MCSFVKNIKICLMTLQFPEVFRQVLANRVGPGQMLQNVASHWGLHYLP